MLPSFSAAILTVAFFAFAPQASGQFLNGLPQCIRNCIDESSTNCEVTDVTCLCKASSGNFLPGIVSCMHGRCTDIDTTILLAPLKLACVLAGAPIPDDALQSIENQESSTANEATKTVTIGGPASVSTATVTTTQEGSTYTLVFPVTIKQTTTISGEPSTMTTTSTEDGSTVLIPIIIISTDDEGTAHTMTSTQTGSISQHVTTDSDGSTTTQMSTYTGVASSKSSDSILSTSSSTESSDSGTGESALTSTTFETSATVAGTAVTSSDLAQTSAENSRASETSERARPTQLDSSPFTDTNSEATKTSVGALVSLGVLLFALAMA